MKFIRFNVEGQSANPFFWVNQVITWLTQKEEYSKGGVEITYQIKDWNNNLGVEYSLMRYLCGEEEFGFRHSTKRLDDQLKMKFILLLTMSALVDWGIEIWVGERNILMLDRILCIKVDLTNILDLRILEALEETLGCDRRLPDVSS